MCFISPSSFSSFFSAPFAVIVNRPFLSCLKPLFQSEAKCEAIVMKMFFFLFSFRSKLIFTTEVFPLASFCKGEVLELGNGLFLSVSSPVFFSPDDTLIVRRLIIHRSPAHLSNKKMRVELTGGITDPEYISSSAGRNDSGTFFLPCYAYILYQKVRGGQLRGKMVMPSLLSLILGYIGAVLVVAAVKDFAHA